MTNLKVNNGIYLKLIALFSADQKAQLAAMNLNSVEKAVFAAKVFQSATGDKIENVLSLIFGKDAYKNNKAELDLLLA